MIEERSRPAIYDWCRDRIEIPQLVRLKGKKPKPEKFPGFFTGTSRFEVWDRKLVHGLVNAPTNAPIRLAVGVFTRNGGMLAQAFIEERYNGNFETAFQETGTFDTFFNGFKDYFAERKARFMEKTEEIIKQTHPGIAEQKIRVPHSHGGVANLLKVLTKTMHEQGSSIRTIAKVQYAICTQAGIFVPEEFITDVLVAADIDPNVFEEGKQE